MPELRSVHCRHCGQTFLSNPANFKCDLCGKTGGIVDPDIAFQEKLQSLQKAEANKPKREFGWREIIQSCCFLLLVMAVVNIVRAGGEAGVYTWSVNIGSIVLGNIGLLVLYLFPRKKAPTDPRTSQDPED
jgi:hypothetical protein